MMGTSFPYLKGKKREQAEAATLAVYHKLMRQGEERRAVVIRKQKRRERKRD